MGQLGLGELVVILVIVLLFVGGKRLPELARSLGEAVREFQRALKDDKRDADKKKDEH